MQLATSQINKAGGAGRRTLELIFEDTCGLPEAGVRAVSKLAQKGIHALAGEYHSVVANAVVDKVDSLGLPFVCASATLDAITSRRLSHVFRLSPPQSYGWRVYASYIATSGIGHVFAVMEDSPYWKAGAGAIESRLLESGVPFTRLLIGSKDEVVGAIERAYGSLSQMHAPSMLLLLVSYPEPLRSLLHQIHTMRPIPSPLILGDPAGRTIFRDWWEVAGSDAVRVPFLAYENPRRLTSYGESAAKDFEQEYGREPSFVALEGYDSILVLEAALKAAGSTDPAELCSALRRIEIQGTRGTIRFSTEPEGVVHQQWKWPPTCVVSFQDAHQDFSKSEVLWDANLTG